MRYIYQLSFMFCYTFCDSYKFFYLMFAYCLALIFSNCFFQFYVFRPSFCAYWVRKQDLSLLRSYYSLLSCLVYFFVLLLPQITRFQYCSCFLMYCQYFTYSFWRLPFFSYSINFFYMYLIFSFISRMLASISIGVLWAMLLVSLRYSLAFLIQDQMMNVNSGWVILPSEFWSRISNTYSNRD